MAVYDDTNKISTGRTNKGVGYNIYYMGGSRCDMKLDDGSTLHLTFTAVEKLVKERKISLISTTKFKTFKNGILPDGSTTTHNADGTLKSKRTQTMESLINERIVTSDGSSLVEDEEPSAPKMPEKKVPGPEDVMDSIDDLDNPARGRNVPPMETPMSPSDNSGENDAPDTIQQPVRTARANNRLEGDLNGDGVVDEFDSIIKKEQSKNPLVMIIFFGGIIASIFLFFFFHAVTSGIFQGEVTFLPDIPALEQKEDTGSTSADDGGGGASEDTSTSDEQQQQSAQDDGTIETYKRTDFDPEDAVANFPLADLEHEKIGVFLMQQIRQNFTDANWSGEDGFLSSVDIERIAGQLAPEYAQLAKEVQNLTDLEKEELQQSWQTTFVNVEHQHLLDKDPYGSIFCGRPREIRQDPNNPNCIYIVTESSSGDHQRICFAANGDPTTNNWKITDVLDPRGYCAMIQEGEAEL